MDRRVPARMALSQPPYWVWKEGTDFETGVGWIRRLGAHAHSHVARGCAALGQAEATLEYLSTWRPAESPPSKRAWCGRRVVRQRRYATRSMTSIARSTRRPPSRNHC